MHLARIRCRYVSSYARGLRFEQVCVRVLSALPFFSLEHSGSSGDRGIDFFGVVRSGAVQLRCCGQCKYEQQKPSAAHIRSLESALSRYIATRNGGGEGVGFFVSNKPPTRDAATAHRNSALPIVVVMIQPDENDGTINGGVIQRFELNASARAILPFLRIGRRFDRGRQKLVILAKTE